MNKLSQVSLPIALLGLGAMAFVFFFVREGLGDAKAAGLAVGAVLVALGAYFQDPPGGNAASVTP